MLLEIEHYLTFSYEQFIRESHLEVRVEPRSQSGQMLHDFRLTLGPNTRITRFEDWMGNAVHWFSITDYHDRIELLVQSIVDTSTNPVKTLDCKDPLSMEPVPLPYFDFTLCSGPILCSDALRQLQSELHLSNARSIGECVRMLGDGLSEGFEYQKNVTSFDSTTDDFLEQRGGVCQDFAHLSIGLLRTTGVPCRYVSGYLHVDTQDIEPSQSHAWIELWSPSNGWMAFDPTHNRQPDERYVIVGYGRSYNDVPPNRGIYSGGAAEQLEAKVVTRPGTSREHPQLDEDSMHIDLPVYRELPEREGRAELAAGEAAASQQQQQQ